MEIRPILSTLSRHKTAAALIVLEIALSCAIICNALFIVSQRLETLNLASGIDDDRLVEIGLSGIGQRIGLPHLDVHRPAPHDIEQFAGAGDQILAFGGIGHQGRAGEKQGPLGRQNSRLEGRHRPRGVAKADHHPHRLQAIQRPHEGLLTYGIIDYGNPLAIGDFPNALYKIFPSVNNSVMTPVRLG